MTSFTPRRQFSAAINIRISGYGVALLRAAPRLLGIDPTVREGGDFFVATEAGRAELAANHATATEGRQTLRGLRRRNSRRAGRG